MTQLDPETLETLLYCCESETLDFKEQQYPIANATDDQKSEFVKDIIAFANAWRTADAHILVGVRDVPGQRATVLGGISHVDDATLQQIVSKRTNRPVAFDYIPTTVDGQSIGVFRIRRQQERPIFLPKAYGRLKPNVVYVRRGSSTDEAKPDEIARMGRSDFRSEPTLALGIRSLDAPGPSGITATVCSTLLRDRPAVSVESPMAGVGRFRMESILQRGAFRSWNESRDAELRDRLTHPSRADMHAYLRERERLTGLVVELVNHGQVVAKDVRVVLEFECEDGVEVQDYAPSEPQGILDIARTHYPSANATVVEKTADSWLVTLQIGKVQPSATVSSDPFWVGGDSPRTLSMAASVFGDNIPQVIRTTLSISIETRVRYLEDLEEESDGDDFDDS